MGELVELAAWRARNAVAVGAEDDGEIRRLEVAVARLDEAATARLEAGRLTASVETELLAILGALAADLVDEAAARAERLAKRLSSARTAQSR
jgi:hypothetical protein